VNWTLSLGQTNKVNAQKCKQANDRNSNLYEIFLKTFHVQTHHFCSGGFSESALSFLVKFAVDQGCEVAFSDGAR